MDGSIFGSVLVRGEAPVSSDDRADAPITAQIATTEEVFRDAWGLRHAAYSSHGFIEPNASGMFQDECDHYPSSRVIVAYKGHVPVGTVRVCMYAPGSGLRGSDSIPAMEVFPEEIRTLLAGVHKDPRDTRAVEVMRLSTHPEIANDREIVYALYLMAGYVTLQFNANAVICAVRQHHMPFYRRLGFEKITEPRAYPKLKFLTGLMACVHETSWELKQAMPILRTISRTDSRYADFVAGRPVPVFDDACSASSLGRLFSRRAETNAASRPAPAQHAELQLAA